MLGAVFCCSALADNFSKVSRIEQEIKRRDYELERLVDELGSWLAGRITLSNLLDVWKQVKGSLVKRSLLPQGLSLRLSSAEQGILDAVYRFANNSSPDLEGQQKLFRSLNELTRKRSLALLDWRSLNNRDLLSSSRAPAQLKYLQWEASWLIVWRSEVEVSYELQEACLASGKIDDDRLSKAIRQALALQARAELIGAPDQLKKLQEAALSHLTVLARTAEQLQRFSETGGSNGTLVRIQRLNKEQVNLAGKLQGMRISIISGLAAKQSK